MPLLSKQRIESSISCVLIICDRLSIFHILLQQQLRWRAGLRYFTWKLFAADNRDWVHE